ncbi:MAG: CehA/McbA family metallohydrolase [Eubacterium sp.]|nr:CehA/McbA family metallohydrolase [Eubacterium sp.]
MESSAANADSDKSSDEKDADEQKTTEQASTEDKTTEQSTTEETETTSETETVQETTEEEEVETSSVVEENKKTASRESKPQTEGVFFSEYVEVAKGNNKALEIYNGTGSDIDLSEYSVKLFANGATDATNTHTFAEGTILKANSVAVLVNKSADPELLDKYVESTVCNFNGDDAVALYHNNQLIDVIGTIGEKTNWADGSKKTTDCTLVRTDEVEAGNTEFSFAEWTAYTNTKQSTELSYLGTHKGGSLGLVKPSEEQNVEEISIKAFKEKKDTTKAYAVKGIVTYVAGKTVYLQDGEAGICAFYATADSTVKVGDTLTVKGTWTEYKGLVEITGAATVKRETAVEGAAGVTPTELSIADLIEKHDTYEGMLISLDNVVIGELNTSGKTTLTDEEGKSVVIYKCPELSENMITGSVVNVTALVSDSDGVQLIVRNSDDVVEKYETITIAEARAINDGTTECTVKGIVTFIDKQNVYIQDNTAGIVAYFGSDKAEDIELSIGDVIYVKGIRANFKGLEEITGPQNDTGKNTSPDLFAVVKTKENQALPEREVTIQQLLDDQTEGTLEATRVLVKSVTLGTTDSKKYTPITDKDGKSIKIYNMPTLTGISAGDTVDVYAIVGDYNGIQLRVASADDVILVEEEEPEEPVEIYDPISDEDFSKVEGAINVKEAAALTSGTATVLGQVVYKYVSNATDTSLKNILLEDVIDGTIYGYLVYDYNNSDKYEVGNIVAVTGTATEYGGVPEVKDVTNVTVLKNVDPIEAQEVTVSQLGADYLSEYVLIKDVTLGAYNAGGATSIKDATGESTIFKGVAYPDGITEGSVVDLYAACTAYKTTYQLKTATAKDYVVKGSADYEIDDSVELTVASFAGTASFEGNTVYGDLYTENDFLDKSTKLTLSTGAQPLISNTSTTTGGTTHSIGSKGLLENEYYQIETSSAQYGNLELSFFMKGSGTGAKNLVLEYSTDGENFKAAGTGTLKCSYTQYASDGSSSPVNIEKTISDGAFSLQTASKMHEIQIALPAEANNAEKLFLRVRVTDNTSIKGTTIGTGGTNYFNDIKLTANPLVSDAFCNYVTVSPEAGETVVGQELTLKTGTRGAKIYYAFDGASEYTEYNADSKPVIKELPCTLTAYAAKDGIDDSIKCTYCFTQTKVATVKATPNGGAVALNSKVKLSCETEGAEILYAFKSNDTKDETVEKQETVETTETVKAATDAEETYDWKTYTEALTLTELPCTIYVKAVKEGCTDSEIKTLSFTERTNEKYNIYFGQMHAHTSYSDGAGTCEEAFKYAKNEVDNLDFLCVTDHSNSFDSADSASITDGSMSSEWLEGHELAEKYTDDTFVGIMGYEMTWSNGLGHMNTFNSEGFQSRTQDNYKTFSTALNNYYNTLQSSPDSISQFNHPGTTFGDFQDFAYYSEANDSLITLVEVGNGEGAIGSSGYFPSYEYYQRALDKGWHVSPTNNQDNHKGKWGSANTARSVVLADSLTEENIYDAMRNNRIYATEDNDLSIYYTLDNYIMGTVLDKDLVDDKVTLKVELSDPTDAKLGKVEVIVNGGLSIASETVTTNETTLTFEVPSNYSFYYIKVTEGDGDIAVTTPVWVGSVEAVGINGLSTDTTLPIAGEALDVTLDLYNNESTDLELNEITFTVDDKVVETVDLEKAGLTKVESEKTASYTFSYTHNEIGSMEIDVTVKATLNGVEKVYTDKLQLSYTSNDLVSHVVIDGSHYNDYVTGYYGGNMGEFISLAAKKNIKAEIVKDTFTEDTLKDADLLIISAPAKKSGTANAGDYNISHFEDSFIALVKEYVANGGTVIFCGIADYQDSTNGQTATELNKLLEAIGATIRVNSDEAYDEVNNGGQPYRLYYTNFNSSDAYMANIVNGQTYSAYSGCTIDITNATENETVNTAIPLVKGFDTTYSIDCKTDAGAASDSSVYVEKGNVVALAYQTTKAGGAIFVGGSVFMSDFEVSAEIDNNDSLPYANYTIINNILDTKTVVMEATDIAAVRKAELGEIFAIEGYVANGTDNENTTFFDTIYVEDETAGITVFPFATAGIAKGTKIRCVGYVDAYQGDKELQILSYEILDDKNLKKITATPVSTKQQQIMKTTEEASLR